MKRYVICIFTMVVFLTSFAQKQPMVLKSFTINGVKQNLNNNYSLYFVYQGELEKLIYIPTIKNDTFYESEVIPSEKKTKYYWLLNYKGKIYYFDYGWFFNFEWPAEIEIIIETKSYDKYNRYKWECKCPSNFADIPNYQGVVYVRYGGEFIACKSIENMKSYFRKGEEILGNVP